MIDLKKVIRTIPDYPKPGIMFRDITTLLADGPALRTAVDLLAAHAEDLDIDLIAGIEARGFILGGAVCDRLACGFIPVRKKGKLPYETISHDYELEYGTDTLEVHKDCVRPGERVLVLDDLLATGGTAEAAIALIEKAGGHVAACSFVVDLPDLGGRKRLEKLGKSVTTLVEFEGD